jgi:hypothetical protein
VVPSEPSYGPLVGRKLGTLTRGTLWVIATLVGLLVGRHESGRRRRGPAPCHGGDGREARDAGVLLGIGVRVRAQLGSIWDIVGHMECARWPSHSGVRRMEVDTKGGQACMILAMWVCGRRQLARPPLLHAPDQCEDEERWPTVYSGRRLEGDE